MGRDANAQSLVVQWIHLLTKVQTLIIVVATEVHKAAFRFFSNQGLTSSSWQSNPH